MIVQVLIFHPFYLIFSPSVCWFDTYFYIMEISLLIPYLLHNCITLTYCPWPWENIVGAFFSQTECWKWANAGLHAWIVTSSATSNINCRTSTTHLLVVFLLLPESGNTFQSANFNAVRKMSRKMLLHSCKKNVAMYD